MFLCSSFFVSISVFTILFSVFTYLCPCFSDHKSLSIFRCSPFSVHVSVFTVICPCFGVHNSVSKFQCSPFYAHVAVFTVQCSPSCQCYCLPAHLFTSFACDVLIVLRSSFSSMLSTMLQCDVQCPT